MTPLARRRQTLLLPICLNLISGFGMTACASHQHLSEVSISEDVMFESSEFILKTASRNPRETATAVNENGAYGPKNQTYDNTGQDPWFLDYQKVGADAIIAGICRDDRETLLRGLKIIDWGFRQQRPDGSYSSADTYHNVAYFLAAASRAILHLENSKYSNEFRSDIERYKTSADRTATWLVKPHIEEPGLRKDLPYTHRFYMNAAAIGFTGVLTRRNDLVAHSKNLIRRGLALQTETGVSRPKFEAREHAERTGSPTKYLKTATSIR